MILAEVLLRSCRRGIDLHRGGLLLRILHQLGIRRRGLDRHVCRWLGLFEARRLSSGIVDTSAFFSRALCRILRARFNRSWLAAGGASRNAQVANPGFILKEKHVFFNDVTENAVRGVVRPLAARPMRALGAQAGLVNIWRKNIGCFGRLGR